MKTIVATFAISTALSVSASAAGFRPASEPAQGLMDALRGAGAIETRSGLNVTDLQCVEEHRGLLGLGWSCSFRDDNRQGALVKVQDQFLGMGAGFELVKAVQNASTLRAQDTGFAYVLSVSSIECGRTTCVLTR